MWSNFINMESSNLPILLEEILSGRPEDPQLHYQNSQKLHKALKASSKPTLNGVSQIASEL